ncbi:methionine biosynthesis protein MetW [Chitinivorax sp. B]|uniref:methionine biosynthesis protein MetW n=1 Tax=Chitinivorax sp. B TaxID=2502235 RepID=UPI0010F55933|nr:methionine biosynthesis protein MetW [Chitinivorax sp. B]
MRRQASNKLRPDLLRIANWIKPDTRVLDLGCGDGALLAHLRDTKQVSGYGVEIDVANVIACVANNVDVIQNDLDSGLAGFESDSFDFVVLSLTLQSMRHVEQVVEEMLRVGHEAIVTFPNFGYWKNRLQIFQGHMPVSETIPYEWYNTPNIHLCTIRDFEFFCEARGIHLLDRVVLHNGVDVDIMPNLFGSLAIYRIRRP